MKIQQIRPRDKGFYLIALDEGKDLVLHEEIVARHHLKEGQEIDPEELERCKNDALRRKARERAYYLLEYRDHSEGELYQKLRRHYPDPIAAEAVARCREYGLLDDTAYAKKLAEYYLLRKQFSFRRALMEMGKRGLDRELSRQCLEKVQVDPVQQLQAILSKRYQKQLRQGRTGRQKVFAALARLGFDYEDINTALSEYNWEENEDE